MISLGGVLGFQLLYKLAEGKSLTTFRIETVREKSGTSCVLFYPVLLCVCVIRLA